MISSNVNRKIQFFITKSLAGRNYALHWVSRKCKISYATAIISNVENSIFFYWNLDLSAHSQNVFNFAKIYIRINFCGILMKIDSVERAPSFHRIRMSSQNETAIHVICGAHVSRPTGECGRLAAQQVNWKLLDTGRRRKRRDKFYKICRSWVATVMACANFHATSRV